MYGSSMRQDTAMNFLQVDGKKFVVAGVANKKSVAWHIAQGLKANGAEVIYTVRSAARKEQLAKLVGEAPVYICDVEHPEQIAALTESLRADGHTLIHGLVHSIAFANYPEGIRPFHETTPEQFLQSTNISCFSLIALSNALSTLFDRQASVVTIGISTTTMASESYGFMAPVKAALQSSLAFLTKSFSKFSEVRFNSVSAGLLKTSASAGIPGYIDAYLFAEQVIPRKRALATEEVANTALFLLSPRSSGITAQTVVVDAGMAINYFDRDIINNVVNG
jgi:enoyl-[acyl-carrier protein] reductase I